MKWELEKKMVNEMRIEEKWNREETLKYKLEKLFSS